MKQVETKVTKETVTKDLNYNRDKDREKVRGLFKFYEVPGGTLSFVYKAYKGDKAEKYTMEDNKVYEVPLGVAKHLNKNGWYPVHQHQRTENGTAVRVGQKVHRFGFQSLDFVDLEEHNPSREILTVENAF